MNKKYAQAITKEYLKKLGITNVSEDGYHVWKGDTELKQHFIGKGKYRYLTVCLYDPELRQSISKEQRTNSSGQLTLGVHILNYVWNREDKLEGLIIDHLDNCQLNNHITNLQMITPKENLTKDKRMVNVWECKCQLKKPLSFYEDKLKHYELCYELAKKQKDAEECHKLRSNISQTRARIRYWMAHHEE